MDADVDSTNLVRYWFEFDLSSYENPKPISGVRLDGEHPVYRLLGQGVGVTGFDDADCLELLQRHLAQDTLPRPNIVCPDVDLSRLQLGRVGNPAWRGVWFPAFNIAQPVLD